MAAFLAGVLVFLRRARKQRESKTIDMSGEGALGAASIPNSSYQYVPVTDHKYMHQFGQRGELHSTSTAELGAASPRNNGAAELGVSSPVRGH